MPKRIRANEIEVLTKEGECKLLISLELNINLNGDINNSIDVKKQNIDDKKEEIPFLIPEFNSAEKIKFGKPKGE